MARDARDLRDPSLLGDEYRRLREAGQKIEVAVLADVADYDPQPVDHSTTRLCELQERAGRGDKFAQALLDGNTLAEDPVD